RVLFNLPFHFTAQLSHRASVIAFCSSVTQRFAPQTRTESSFFRDFGLPKKSHLCATRAPRRARWTAINSRRAHSVHECVICAGISDKNRLPAASVRQRICLCGHVLQCSRNHVQRFSTKNMAARKITLSDFCAQTWCRVKRTKRFSFGHDGLTGSIFRSGCMWGGNHHDDSAENNCRSNSHSCRNRFPAQCPSKENSDYRIDIRVSRYTRGLHFAKQVGVGGKSKNRAE